MNTEHRFYGDLAAWWPLISPPEDYKEEASQIAKLLDSAEGPVRTVLELGSGGGHNAAHLKVRFAMTLVDLSEAMLAMSVRLNPECEHLSGDMRTLRLGRSFDAVFLHDAVDYMVSEAELRRAMETVFWHCRPGGVAIFVPDDIADTFQPCTNRGGSDGSDGRAARYLEWTWDPDPADSWVLTEYAFLLRDADGSVSVVHETHRTGLFTRETWLQLMMDTGFVAQAVTEETAEARPPRTLFLGRRPSSGPDLPQGAVTA